MTLQNKILGAIFGVAVGDALREGMDYNRIAAKFIAWYDEALWTAGGKVFDVGITTRHAFILQPEFDG